MVLQIIYNQVIRRSYANAPRPRETRLSTNNANSIDRQKHFPEETGSVASRTQEIAIHKDRELIKIVKSGTPNGGNELKPSEK